MTVSEVLDLARRWQKNQTEIHGTMLIETREWAFDLNGRISAVRGDGIVVSCENGCEVRIVLDVGMTFTFADWMLQITAPAWHCHLYEDKCKPFVRLV